MIDGAISHMALAGGWFARKSPPYTVSSKCSQVESPSPFVFTAPLMPPCAQTECERFTGTTENRSTSWPASAIFIAAARPARPPPPIAILIGVAIVYTTLQNSRNQSTRTNESTRGVNADRQQQQTNRDACVTCQTLRAFADGDSPINHEQPNAVRQVPNCRGNSNHVNDENRNHPELTRYDVK